MVTAMMAFSPLPVLSFRCRGWPHVRNRRDQMLYASQLDHGKGAGQFPTGELHDVSERHSNSRVPCAGLADVWRQF
jgi:hypothetical protein